MRGIGPKHDDARAQGSNQPIGRSAAIARRPREQLWDVSRPRDRPAPRSRMDSSDTVRSRVSGRVSARRRRHQPAPSLQLRAALKLASPRIAAEEGVELVVLVDQHASGAGGADWSTAILVADLPGSHIRTWRRRVLQLPSLSALTKSRHTYPGTQMPYCSRPATGREARILTRTRDASSPTWWALPLSHSMASPGRFPLRWNPRRECLLGIVSVEVDRRTRWTTR